MKPPSPKDQYRLLVEGLLLVAATAEEQVAALPNFVCITDEVILTFCDAFLLAPQLEAAGLISADAAPILKALDEFFERMPRDAGLDDPASLKTDPFWAEARRLAAAALVKLGEEKRPPELTGITWVKGSKP